MKLTKISKNRETSNIYSRFEESPEEVEKSHFFSNLKSFDHTNRSENNFNDKINKYTKKIEDFSISFENEEAKKAFYANKLARIKESEAIQEEPKSSDLTNSNNMEFQKSILKRLLNNTDHENRFMIDAVLQGRIASIN